MMNVVSKTRAHSGPFPDGGMCYEDVIKTLRKIAHSHVSRGNMEIGQACALDGEDEGNQRSTSLEDTGIRPKRYRKNVSLSHQEDLDTNRGMAGQKTWRGGRPIQERDQREYSHHA